MFWFQKLEQLPKGTVPSIGYWKNPKQALQPRLPLTMKRKKQCQRRKGALPKLALTGIGSLAGWDVACGFAIKLLASSACVPGVKYKSPET